MNQYKVMINGRELQVGVLSRCGGLVAFSCLGKEYQVEIEPLLRSSGAAAPVVGAQATAPRQTPHAAGASAHVHAPMPGIVTKVLVSEGSQVEAGQIVAAIEAMKMENNITATRSARVKKVHVKPGVEVQGQQLLIELS